MNPFDQMVVEAINMHGLNCTYKKVSLGSFNTDTLSTTSSEVEYPIKLYPKQLRASQYYLPNLIGKEIVMFYIRAKSLAVIPDTKDKIIYKSRTYLIDSYSEHVAAGEVLLYKVIGVKA